MESFLLQHVPVGVLGGLIVGVAVGLAIGGLLVVRRRVALSTLEAQQDVAGYVFAVVGVVYAVLLAFVVVAVWEQFEEAKAVVDEEAAVVTLLLRDASVLDDPDGRVRRALEAYALSVAGPEWDAMAKDQAENRGTDVALDDVWRAVTDLDPSGSAAVVHDQAIDHLHELTQLRRERIFHSGNRLPGVLWTVLIVGAVVSIGFTYFFGVRSLAAQVLMVSALAAIVGLVLFVILCLDLPFTGDVAVEPESMRSAIVEFGHDR